MNNTIIYNFKISLEAMALNKLRATLTSLGIICGVASVITMLAIGKGAEQEILEKMKLLGTNNIIIDYKEIEKNNKNSNNEENDSKKKKENNTYPFGLTLQDVKSIKKNIPNISNISPEIIHSTTAIHKQNKLDVNLIGVTNHYFNVNPFHINLGNKFLDNHFKYASQVCIIGNDIQTKLFAGANPIGTYIKCGNISFKVIGVLKKKIITENNIKELNLRNYNLDIYIPINTMLYRFKNRSSITISDLGQEYEENNSEIKYNQLDKIIVEITDNKLINQTAKAINKMLLRKHNYTQDFKITVPELLLEQEKNTKKIFNIVLGAIASISLIVGGIGIMNIMLASVLERTKEIGIRRAVGAKQKDILLQFLFEAISISISGGIIGILLGIALSYIIEYSTDIKTIISPFSVLLSFLVSITVGLIFGITPARKASQQDPIELLRYE